MGRYVIDPYATQSPLTDMIGQLGKAMLSGPSASEVEMQRARADYSRLESEKIRRDFQGRDKIAGLAGEQNFNPESFAAIRAEAIRTGDWSKIGELVRTIGLTQTGTPQPVRDSVYMAGGGPASGTETGHKATLQNQITTTGMTVGGANARNAATIASNEKIAQVNDDRANARNAATIASNEKIAQMNDDRATVPVVDADGKLRLMTKRDYLARGPLGTATPVLPGSHYSPSPGADGVFTMQPNQPGTRVAGPGSTGQPFNVRTPTGQVVMSRDGVTDLQGQPIPAGSQKFAVQSPEALGASEGKAIRDTSDALNRARNTLAAYRDTIAPGGKVGPAGFVQRTAQDMVQVANEFGRMAGIDPSAVVSQIVAVSPSVAGYFDETLPREQVLGNVLKYQLASALYGQSGREITNADMKRVDALVGDLNMFSNTPESLARLKTAEEMLNYAIGQNQARGGAPTSPRIGGSAPAIAPPSGFRVVQ